MERPYWKDTWLWSAKIRLCPLNILSEVCCPQKQNNIILKLNVLTSFVIDDWVWVESWQFFSLLWKLKTFLKKYFPLWKLMFPQHLLWGKDHFWCTFSMGSVLSKLYLEVNLETSICLSFWSASLELCIWLNMSFLLILFCRTCSPMILCLL